MNRRDFVRIAGGVLVTLGSPGARAGERRHPLDPSYLELGLTAMARAERWFDAHWGAALIAAYYLCEENDLDGETTAAIEEQLGVVTRTRSHAFRPFTPEPPREGAIASILESLVPTLEGGLRAHGHASIYTALATPVVFFILERTGMAAIHAHGEAG